MKLDCEVIAASTTGDGLRITMQGNASTAAEWRGLERQELVVPDNETTRRAFYVGRKVRVTVKAL